MLEKVFIVVETILGESHTEVVRVFANYKNAVKYTEQMEAEKMADHVSYDVIEREIY